MFLTTLPVGTLGDWREDDMRRSVRAYPLVGLVLGLLLTAAFLLLAPLPELVRAVLLVALWLGLTGALHFDGFVDMADAAFASVSPEARRRIAKDVSTGAFALAAGCVLILLKVAALASLSDAALLLVVLVVSRSLVPLVMARHPVHAASRLGRSSRLSGREAFVPAATGLLVAALCAAPFLDVLDFVLLALSGLGTGLLLAVWLNARIGGLGGDAYGAVIEVSETAMLIMAVAL